MTIDELYDLYIDKGTWGESNYMKGIYEVFGGDEVQAWSQKDWEKRYGMYLPVYDPRSADIARSKMETDIRNTEALSAMSTAETDRVYAMASGKTSTQLESDLMAADEMMSQLGLRSGMVEDAIDSTIISAGDDVENLGDKYMIDKTAIQNKHNASVVGAAMDFDKAEHQSKKEWYDATLNMINELRKEGAFDSCEAAGRYLCSDGVTCVDAQPDCPVDACGHPEGTETDINNCIPGVGLAPGSTTVTSQAGCNDGCVNAGAGVYGGAMTLCVSDCTGRMGGGFGDWNAATWVSDYEQSQGLDPLDKDGDDDGYSAKGGGKGVLAHEDCRCASDLLGGETVCKDNYGNTCTPPKGEPCFSEASIVELDNGKSITVKDLKIGDQIKTINKYGKEEYSEMYAWLHKSEESSEYISINTEGSNKALEISHDHLLMLNGKYRKAKNVKVGDVISGKKVLSVQTVENKGRYTPVTRNGRIVVDGIDCSCYAVYSHGFSHFMVSVIFKPLCKLMPSIVPEWLNKRGINKVAVITSRLIGNRAGV